MFFFAHAHWSQQVAKVDKEKEEKIE